MSSTEIIEEAAQELPAGGARRVEVDLVADLAGRKVWPDDLRVAAQLAHQAFRTELERLGYGIDASSHRLRYGYPMLDELVE